MERSLQNIIPFPQPTKDGGKDRIERRRERLGLSDNICELQQGCADPELPCECEVWAGLHLPTDCA